MDGFLALIIAMLVFVVLIVLISRSVKTIIVLGCIVIAVLALETLGLLGG